MDGKFLNGEVHLKAGDKAELIGLKSYDIVIENEK